MLMCRRAFLLPGSGASGVWPARWIRKSISVSWGRQVEHSYLRESYMTAGRYGQWTFNWRSMFGTFWRELLRQVEGR